MTYKISGVSNSLITKWLKGHFKSLAIMAAAILFGVWLFSVIYKSPLEKCLDAANTLRETTWCYEQERLGNLKAYFGTTRVNQQDLDAEWRKGEEKMFRKFYGDTSSSPTPR